MNMRFHDRSHVLDNITKLARLCLQNMTEIMESHIHTITLLLYTPSRHTSGNRRRLGNDREYQKTDLLTILTP